MRHELPITLPVQPCSVDIIEKHPYESTIDMSIPSDHLELHPTMERMPSLDSEIVFRGSASFHKVSARGQAIGVAAQAAALAVWPAMSLARGKRLAAGLTGTSSLGIAAS